MTLRICFVVRMNVSSMATPQVPSSSCETTPIKLPENAANVSSESPLATAASSTQQQAGTRMLPLLYIQGPTGMRVGTSSAGAMPVSTTSTGTQVTEHENCLVDNDDTPSNV
jgi:hypothetical protein